MNRKMKETNVEWIGKIPEDWNVKKAKEFFSERKSKGNQYSLEILTPSQKYGVIPQTKYQEITGSKPVQIDENADLNNFKTVHKGDFCISLSSYMGGFEFSEYEGVISPAYHCFYCKTKDYNHYYLKYLFKNTLFIDEINKITPQSVRVGRNTAFDKFKYVELPVPPIKEQEKIANYLDKKVEKINQVIKNNQKAIELIEEYKKNIITRETQKGEKIKIKYCSSIQPYVDVSNLNADDKVTFTPMEYIKNGFYIPNETLFNNYSSSYTIYAENDIVLAKVTPCFENGNIAIMNNLTNKIGFGSSELFVIRCKENIINEYMMYCLRNINFIENGKSIMTGAGGLKRISNNFLSNYKINLPDIKEQKGIVKYLDEKCKKINNAIEYRKQIIEKLEEYKKSLIYEVVTGKVEVQ